MSKRGKSKIDWINHVVGFVSVVFGVVMAFWLNNWSEGRSENQTIRTALQNVRNEIAKNQKNLDSTILENRRQYEFLGEYLGMVNDNMSIASTNAEWHELVEKYPNYLATSSSGVRLNLELFQLSEVAWATTHRTGILTSIDFELVFVLEESYDLQKKVNEFDSNLLSALSSVSKSKESFAKIHQSLALAIDLATVLIEDSYPKAIEVIDNYLTN